MASIVTINYKSENMTNVETLCQKVFKGDDEGVGYTCKNLTSNNTMEKVDEFQKTMEMVFEVGLLTIVGILGVIGNVAAVILFAR